MKKKINAVEWAMRHHQIAIMVVCCLVALGVYCLPHMRKNEFPEFIIRQGIVVAVAPGNTSEEMAEQVAKPLEEYIFSYKEVRKDKVFSLNRDGITYIMVELDDAVTQKDEFWSRFKHGVQTFKARLPQNVAAIIVNDDFGDTSALLITMESDEKTYRELSDLMERLQDRLRTISSVGRMTVHGMQQEQISVTLDDELLSRYGLNSFTVAQSLQTRGFQTDNGRLKSNTFSMPIHVSKSLNTVYDVEQLMIHNRPSGTTVRLKDVATVKREFPEAESRITNNGRKCLLLSVEMKKGQNIVKMGEDINEQLEAFQQTLPSDVSIYRITDQSKVVGDSVNDFLRELIIAIVAVVIVVMLLLPMKVALVAASTIPITIFVSLGLYHSFGIELNTVTLAALIVTLGMIVDDCIIIIDNYLEQIGEGKPRWEASVNSATHFFKSVLTATLAISITFFPFLITCTGQIYDFVASFPWSICIVLAISLAVATLLIPFMQYFFIRKPLKTDVGKAKGFSLLDIIQKVYDKLLNICFLWPRTCIAIAISAIIAGPLLLKHLPLQMMPVAERDQFAVEIFLPTGTQLAKTSLVADSLEHILRRDKRVVSVTSFRGSSSPRFHTAYAPQMVAGGNYVQFIVNTTGDKATEEVLDDYAERYADYFPEAIVKFKQLSFNPVGEPVEVRLSHFSADSLTAATVWVDSVMRSMPELSLVRSDYCEPQALPLVVLKDDEASRVGVTNALVEMTLSMRYGKGVKATTVWEGDDQVPVILRSTHADSATTDDLLHEQIPVLGGIHTVPLRQVATVVPTVRQGQVARRNGIPTVTVKASVKRGYNILEVTEKLKEKLSPDIAAKTKLPSELNISYGGEDELTGERLPSVIYGLAIAAVMIFFILVSHFKRLSLSLLIFGSIFLSLFGAAVGLTVVGRAFSVTAILGLVCLMGIIVRNGIIMYDYAEELRRDEGMSVRDGIWHSASRRMRPIFLTSAAASMGVVPMILGGSSLWMPMGAVICFGTLITMLFILTALPVAYLLVFRKSDTAQQLATTVQTE